MSVRPQPSARRAGLPPPRGRRGFTLIELIVGMAVMAVLMGAMVSSLAVASRALDDRVSPTARARAAATVVEEMHADLSEAQAFLERTASAVTFVVPDRNDDGRPEVIRYEWTGPADQRLLRTVNSGPAVAVAENVELLNLTYVLKTIVPTPDPPPDPDPPDGDGGHDGGGQNGRGKWKDWWKNKWKGWWRP